MTTRVLHLLRLVATPKWLLFWAVVLFSFVNVLVKDLSRITPFQIVLIRAFVTLVTMAMLLRLQRISFQKGSSRLLLLRGLAGTAGMLLYFWSLQLMPLASAISLHYLNPLFLLAISALFLNERMPIRFLPPFLLCAVGVFLIENFDPLVSWQGVAIALSANVFAASAYAIIRKLKGKAHPYVIVFCFSLIGIPLVFPFAWAHWRAPTPEEWAKLLGLGLMTSVAQIFLTQAYQREAAHRISHITYLGILLGTLYGPLFFGDKLTPTVLTGIGMIFLGVFGVNWLQKVRQRRSHETKIEKCH